MKDSRLKKGSKDWDRFWSKVEKGPGCWEWVAGCFDEGYGCFSINKRSIGSHRIVYEMGHGEIPKGMLICHHCDNRRCVRPSHLFIGTQSDNLKDASNKGRMNRGTNNPACKLTEQQILAIRKDTRPQREIAKDYKVDQRNIWSIIHRQTWKHI